ncbi:MAG: 50S ribosomal protein L15 [Legionellaceae bacterium]|nr:50S ribosomal protein L15 [Legionellaceae bacterium]
MQLNTLKPAKGAKHNTKRLGRGIGSGKGKTCGRGHKGQRSRSGKNVKRGFEGGQMPLQRRLPKFGFTSRQSLVRDEVRLHELNQFKGEVTIETLRTAGLIRSTTLYVKVIATGEIKTAVQLRGIKATKQAVEKITAAGGKVE